MSRVNAALRRVVRRSTIAVAGTLVLGPLAAGNVAAAGSTIGHGALPATLFVANPPPGATGPDDITRLATDGVDRGRALVWTAYQNGINPDGTPGTPGGPTKSTVAGYDPTNGRLVTTFGVEGKVDGLTADPAAGRLIATVNEDENSALDVINVAGHTVRTYRYDPSPAVHDNGGTDSIAIWDGQVVLAHSNPNDVRQATDYVVTLDDETGTAHLRPLFHDDSTATDALSGATVTLALTDPDTNAVVSDAAPRFAGQLATISQADGQVVFASHDGDGVHLTVLGVSDNRAGNIPPIDGLAVATEQRGTLYVVDAAAGTITALTTNGLAEGTVFVSEPSDNNNPLVGTLDLFTGRISPLGNAFQSPKGVLFVPAGDGR